MIRNNDFVYLWADFKEVTKANEGDFSAIFRGKCKERKKKLVNKDSNSLYCNCTLFFSNLSFRF